MAIVKHFNVLNTSGVRYGVDYDTVVQKLTQLFLSLSVRSEWRYDCLPPQTIVLLFQQFIVGAADISKCVTPAYCGVYEKVSIKPKLSELS